MAAAVQAGLGFLQLQPVERAGRVADRRGGDLRIARRRRQIAMAEQHLDHADVGAGFEQMGGEAVAQRMDGDRLAELRRRPSVSARPLQHARVERPALVLARKQPMRRPGFPPIGAQHDEQLRRQHDVAVPTALALFDPDQHAAAIDIGDFQPHDFGDPQPGGVGRHQRGAVLQARHRREKPRRSHRRSGSPAVAGCLRA